MKFLRSSLSLGLLAILLSACGAGGASSAASGSSSDASNPTEVISNSPAGGSGAVFSPVSVPPGFSPTDDGGVDTGSPNGIPPSGWDFTVIGESCKQIANCFSSEAFPMDKLFLACINATTTAFGLDPEGGPWLGDYENACAEKVSILSCGSKEVQSAYSPDDPENFSNIGAMVSTDAMSSCAFPQL